MKKTIYKKPAIFQLTVGFFVSVAQSIFTKKEIPIPLIVSKYKLVNKIDKEVVDREYGVGVYKHKGKKVFIKTWTGRVKNFRYYSLIKEYSVSKVLYEKLKDYKNPRSKYFIKTSRVIDCIENHRSVSIVFEYIEGKTLTTLSLKEQTEVISNIITTFHSISNSFTDGERMWITTRASSFYFFSLPLFTLTSIVLNLKNFNKIIKALFNCLQTLSDVRVKNLYLSHGDLETHNIIKNKSEVYVLDCEKTAFTISNYDISYLSFYPYLKRLAKSVCTNMEQTPNIFIKNYLSIQLGKFYDDPKGVENF